MTLFEKTVKGTLFGSGNPMHDIPQPGRPLPGRQAQARRAGHQHVHARPDQPGLTRTCSTARTSAASSSMSTERRQLRPVSAAAPRGRRARSSACAARPRCSPPRWRPAATSSSKGRPAPGKSTLLRAVADAAGLGRGVRRGQRRADARPGWSATTTRRWCSRRGYTPETLRRRPAGHGAARGQPALHRGAQPGAGGDAQRARRRARRGRDPRARGSGASRRAPSFRLIAAMNPFDAVGTARVSQAISDRMCRIAIGYQDAAARARDRRARDRRERRR